MPSTSITRVAGSFSRPCQRFPFSREKVAVTVRYPSGRDCCHAA
ncbi:MAG: hypothetical protein ABIP20_03375 [Chthoniobacteraceae bacterium]